MIFNSDRHNLIFKVLLTGFITSIASSFKQPVLAMSNQTQKIFQSYQVVVNSEQDGAINPDQKLTLREAISLVNNTISWSDLSIAEQKQVKPVEQIEASRIEFGISSPMTIALLDTLPPLISPGLVVDGTSHSAYDPQATTTVEIPIPIPVVSLTPATNTSVFRGLTIAGDRIQVKGLSIYGFDQPNNPTETTPGADIVVSSRLTHLESESSLSNNKNSPKDVAIIDNWLGLPPDESINNIPSNFGIWLFDGVNTKIKRNRIYHHGGSGILTSVKAHKTKITENIIVGNGLSGMPHAIYLEGQIRDSQITNNLLCGNDGSGVYLFKSDGKIIIKDNIIKFNGRRVSSAAIYLIGSDHQVTDNEISWQTGTGVTIAAYPTSQRNLIVNNSFSNLEGLSIDLNTRHRTDKPLWKLGDGVNPPRNSSNRQRDTANKAINAPQFLSEDFYLVDGKINIDGVADPGAKITLYQVDLGNRQVSERGSLASQSSNYGPLSKPLINTIADADGKFSFSLNNLAPGTVISAIATKPEDGTSEPAFNATINSLGTSDTTVESSQTFPKCTTKPVAKVSKPPIKIEIPPQRRAVSLNVPRNIHFALDKSAISPVSAGVLNKIATVLKKYPFVTIELQGHTDFRASSQYNMTLSRDRAETTRNYLLKQGIDPARITILSLGESHLKKSGNTIVDHAYNRRVEMIFRDFGGMEIVIEEQNSDLQLER